MYIFEYNQDQDQNQKQTQNHRKYDRTRILCLSYPSNSQLIYYGEKTAELKLGSVLDSMMDRKEDGKGRVL